MGKTRQPRSSTGRAAWLTTGVTKNGRSRRVGPGCRGTRGRFPAPGGTAPAGRPDLALGRVGGRASGSSACRAALRARGARTQLGLGLTLLQPPCAMREECQVCHQALLASSSQGRAGGIQGSRAPTMLPSPLEAPRHHCASRGGTSSSTSQPLCEVSDFTNTLPQEPRGSPGPAWVRGSHTRAGGSGRLRFPGLDRVSNPLKVQKPPRRAVPASRECRWEGGAWFCPWCPEQPHTADLAGGTAHAHPPSPRPLPLHARGPSAHGPLVHLPGPRPPQAQLLSATPGRTAGARQAGLESRARWTVSGVGHLLAARSWSPTLATREPGRGGQWQGLCNGEVMGHSQELVPHGASSMVLLTTQSRPAGVNRGRRRPRRSPAAACPPGLRASVWCLAVLTRSLQGHGCWDPPHRLP